MKNNFNARNSYLISCVCSILILMSICYFGIDYTLKGTRAGFGGLTGCLAPTISVSYYSNYPDNFDDLEAVNELACSQYVVSNNMYVIPSGYEFIGWDTSNDGGGDRYSAGSVIHLEENLNLYAQWSLIVDDEIDSNPEDGTDEDIDTDVDDDTSSGDNTDNNGDTSQDDIEIPEGDNSTGENTDDSNNTENGDSSSGAGTGDSGSGIGGDNNNSSSTGDGNTSGNNSGQSTNNNQNNDNKVNSSTDKDTGNNSDSNDGESSVPEKVFYNFKFMHNDKEYSNSSCEVLTDGNCLLLLPGVNPNKHGYTFTGWSLYEDCPTTEIITSSISVNSSNTYYACFIKNVDNNTGVNFVTVGITVFVIWVIALTLIYCVVKWFKKKENND